MIDYVLEINCEPERDDELQARLFLTAATGNTSANGVVTAYFDSVEDRDAARSMLEDFTVFAEDRPRVDWLEKYQQSLEPLRIARHFIVAPDAALIEDDDERPYRIVVPQEQAFGTGSHETTSLCMEILETIDMRGKRGLDIGSGSGILAIAMLLLGARSAIAFDNDPDAYGPLRDNRMRNRVPESAMPLFIGSVEAMRGGTFDVVTMNIIPEVIIPLLPMVLEHVSGDLILSGILNVRRDDVVKAAPALQIVEERSKGEWWCGRFQRLRNRSMTQPGTSG